MDMSLLASNKYAGDGVDVDALLGRRKFAPSKDAQPAIQQYDPAEVLELEKFCKKYGIVGIGFRGMAPRAVLQMLKRKMGINEEASARSILHG